LRPEVLESNFYAFRSTGDPKYLERAKIALDSFNRVLAINDAYAGINDVNNSTGGGFIDDTESFFFAEVLKYLYLTFDDPNYISLDYCASVKFIPSSVTINFS
jgi:mannosyl-oligosaccharide alpha-1,2-mannosidase